jgi:Heparinase II/III-like protein/Fungalysin/Thermolysin Propeptide Motif
MHSNRLALVGVRVGLALALLAAGLGLLHKSDAASQQPRRLTVDRVQPRPRLFFAPGEFERFVRETQEARAPYFEALLDYVQDQGARAWNERDLQLQSQVLVARVLHERGDRRADAIFGLARRSLRFFLDQHTFTEWRDVHEMVTAGSRWLEAVALAYDWAYPMWTERERAEMADWLRVEIDNWVDGNRVARASSSPFRNDSARGVSGLVAAGLTIFDEGAYAATAQKALAYALPFYDEILQAHQHAGADGGLTEGTFYGSLTAWSQAMVAEMLFTGAGSRGGYRSPFFLARLRYAVHAAWPGYITNQFGFSTHQLAPIFGDARRGPTGSTLRHRATVLLLGKRLKDEEAARQAYAVVNRPETGRTYVREWSLYDLLLWSPAVSPEMPTALAYRERTLGQVFARSDWSDNATWISFNAGPHLDTHQHYDAGALTIYRNGVDLLVDSGTFDAFGSKHWYNYYVRSAAHNTLLIHDPEERWDGIWGGVPENLTVNDGGQRTQSPLTPAPTLQQYLDNRDAYDHATIERYQAGDWGLYIKSNLTNAYQNSRYQSTKPNHTRNRVKVDYVGREVVYLRRREGRRDGVVVFDRIVSANPSFRKAALWHVREPFAAGGGWRRVDEGESTLNATSPLSVQTTASFRQGSLDGRARLFITVLPVDPVRVRQIGARPSTGERVDHETFGTKHHHRHLKDYLVEDSRITNSDAITGAPNRQEWPPIAPPEVQWLWNDDLAGGWGKSRLQVEPAAPAAADRFLTLFVPTDADDGAQPQVELVRGANGQSVGMRWTEGGRDQVVLFGSENSGGDLTETSIEIAQGSGELLIVGLRPDTGYRVSVAGSRSIEIRAGGSLSSGSAGVLRLDLRSLSPLASRSADQASSSSSVSGGSIVLGSTASGATAGSSSASMRSMPFSPVSAGTAAEAGRWRSWIDERLRDGRLAIRSRWSDPQSVGRVVERLEQRVGGVPVYGGEVVVKRQDDTVTSMFGALSDVRVEDAGPPMTRMAARQAIEHAAGVQLPREREPSLVVVSRAEGGEIGARAYCDRLLARDGPRTICVDAAEGRVLFTLDETRRRTARAARRQKPPVFWLEDDESIVGYVNGIARVSARDRADRGGRKAEALEGHQSEVLSLWAERYGLGDVIRTGPIVALLRPSGGRLMPPMYLGRSVMLFADAGGSDAVIERAQVAHELAHVLIDRSSRLLPIGESAALEEEFARLLEELTLGRRLADDRPLRAAFWAAVEKAPDEKQRLEQAVVHAFVRLLPPAATSALARAATLTAYADLGGDPQALAAVWPAR